MVEAGLWGDCGDFVEGGASIEEVEKMDCELEERKGSVSPEEKEKMMEYLRGVEFVLDEDAFLGWIR